MDTNWLLLSMLYSTVGLGMFMYGKKAVRFVPLIAGLALMIVPFVITSILWMSIISIALIVCPLVLGRFEMF
jgi:hypothetical protein